MSNIDHEKFPLQDSHDIYVQCTRCRNKHMESDRVESAPDRYGMRTLKCPKCGGHNFYKLDATAAA